MAVAPAALAAAQQRLVAARLKHIRYHAAADLIPHHRTHGYLNDEVFAPLAGAAVAGAVCAVLGGVLRLEAEVQQRVHIRIGEEDHVAANAAVAAVGAAVEHELLPMEGHAAVAAVARLRRNLYMIYKITHEFLLKNAVKTTAIVLREKAAYTRMG